MLGVTHRTVLYTGSKSSTLLPVSFSRTLRPVVIRKDHGQMFIETALKSL